jgi:hypothetical protein
MTKAGSRAIAHRAAKAPSLIAGRRLSDNPKGAFRAISGLVLALFVTTVALSLIAALNTDLRAPGVSRAAGGVVVDQFEELSGVPSFGAVPASRLSAISGIGSLAGVRDVVVIRQDPAYADTIADNGTGTTGYVLCSQLASAPALGKCAPGETIATITPDFFDVGQVIQPTTEAIQASTVWPSAGVSTPRSPGISSAQFARLPIDTVAVVTTGTSAAIEEARTALDQAFPFLAPVLTIGEVEPSTVAALEEGQHLADVIIVASLVIAGCSLAVSVAGGLTERKKPFSLLRLTGVPLGVLRRVVAIEGAVPLIAGAALAIGTGFLAAELSISAVFGLSLPAPSSVYYLIVGVGIVASLAVIASTFPLLSRITGPEVARNE